MSRRFVVVLTLLCVSLVIIARPAAASCVGASWDTETRTVRRGGAIVVEGVGWGTQCFEDGIPPGARGTLGDPQTNLTLTIVQEPRHVDVAHGDARADYSWTAVVVVPIDLEPGPAALDLSTPAPFSVYSRLLLEITDEPPLRGGTRIADVRVIDFGTDLVPAVQETSGDGVSRGGIVVLIGVAAIVTAVAVARRVRRCPDTGP